VSSNSFLVTCFGDFELLWRVLNDGDGMTERRIEPEQGRALFRPGVDRTTRQILRPCVERLSLAAGSAKIVHAQRQPA
jgi:hypothetical protein